MKLNEIKKALYTQRPEAVREYVVKLTDPMHKYSTRLADGRELEFMVPESDMGDGKFENTMPAQLLIRWIVL